ncbi:MAG TPA: phenylalanine--tRNA ligase subunit beta, partial [Candidatus Polarisedimenticolia bacterium]|nr:phenylalanine--tRNA ligase subunit beta [Candidatus Polarisedimenticolia bacterium]
MRFSLDWIREFVKVDEAPAELARRLTSAGLAVETIEPQPDGDVVLDLEIFPNRPDCMSIYGVAREVAAATGRSLCPFPGAQEETDTAPPAAALARVSIDRADLCGRYDARVMTGVRVGPSPDWMVRRLATVGLRSVNNIVDATNYVLWEFGHPLHAFDLETLEGREIRVRLAQRAETLTTLDGVSRTLDESMLVIADAKRAVALAGVMGGAPTMVTGATVHLLLESAHFDPVSVRRTARKLGLSTDASYRFERGADPEATVIALNRVASLIRRAAGGSIHPGVVEARPAPPAARRLRLRSARVARLLGVAVEPARIREALEALHFGAAPRPSPGPADASGAPGASPDLEFEVDVPSHRQDIEREVDLIEEVARRIGYDSIPERLPDIPGSGGIERPGHRREGAIRATLLAGGFSEACTTTFASSALDWGLRQRLDPAEPAIEPIGLVNPIAIDLEILRTTLLGGLLASVARNFNHGTRDVRLFEIGRVFRRGEAPPPSREERKHPSAGPVEESVALGLALAGNVHPAHFTESPREASFYDLKGVVEALLDDLGLAATLRPLPSSEALDPDRSAL